MSDIAADRLKWYLSHLTENNVRYAVYGAGRRGREIVEAAVKMKKLLPILIFDDNAVGSVICGIQVVSPDVKYASIFDELLLGTDTYQKEMRKSASSKLGNTFRIVDIFRDLSSTDEKAYIEEEPFIKELSRNTEYLIQVLPQLMDFRQNPPPRKFFITQDGAGNYGIFNKLKNDLELAGCSISSCDIDIKDFKNWLKKYGAMAENYSGAGNVCLEKCLEHYLTFKESEIAEGKVLLDVASAGSPFVEMLRKNGICGYNLDMSYAPGMHGYKIGANACKTGLPECFADAITLHCAYECFSGSADMQFIKEAERILKPGGKLCIVPLYLNSEHIIFSSPYCDLSQINFDENALRVWRNDKWREPFSRYYSPEIFMKRIYSIPAELRKEVIFYKNIPELSKEFPGQDFYAYFMFRCVK